MKVAVLASGGGTNLQALLDACGPDAPARVSVVLTNNPSAGALARATQAGVPTALVDDPADGAALLALLNQHEVDLVVLAGYLKLIPPAVVTRRAGAIINIHPALLPAFGGPGMYGMRVHRAVLAAGATISGATVHLVDREYDRGPIIAQWPVPVHASDTPETLHDRILAVEHQLLPLVVLAAARAGHVVRLMPSATRFIAADTAQRLADALVAVP